MNRSTSLNISFRKSVNQHVGVQVCKFMRIDRAEIRQQIHRVISNCQWLKHPPHLTPSLRFGACLLRR